LLPFLASLDYAVDVFRSGAWRVTRQSRSLKLPLPLVGMALSPAEDSKSRGQRGDDDAGGKRKALFDEADMDFGGTLDRAYSRDAPFAVLWSEFLRLPHALIARVANAMGNGPV
jgi:hypothetical protein